MGNHVACCSHAAVAEPESAAAPPEEQKPDDEEEIVCLESKKPHGDLTTHLMCPKSLKLEHSRLRLINSFAVLPACGRLCLR